MHYPPTICYVEPVALEALAYHDDYSFEVVSKKHTISDLRLYAEENFLHETQKFTVCWKHDGEVKSIILEEYIFSLDDALLTNLNSMCYHLAERILKENSNYPDALFSYFYDNLKAIVDKGISKATNMSWPAVKMPDVSTMARGLPGMQVEVYSPCFHFVEKQRLYNLIQHLNDKHKWKREKIADWLDKLMDVDGIDLTFKVEVDEV